MSLRDRLREGNRSDVNRRLYERYGILDNPFPASNHTADYPHFPIAADKEVEDSILSFIADGKSQFLAVTGAPGVGKTNFLKHCEADIREARQELDGYYVIRYFPDPAAAFEGTTRRLFRELGTGHLIELAESLRADPSAIEEAWSDDVRAALRALADADGEDVPQLMMQWLLGRRVLESHRLSLGVQFGLDTVMSEERTLEDLVRVSSAAGVLKGIFLLLDELEKQDGALELLELVSYLSAMRSVVDALPTRLFLMLAITPEALARYSHVMPAVRNRLANQVVLPPLTGVDEAVNLARFYVEAARSNARQSRPKEGGRDPIVRRSEIEAIYWKLDQASRRDGTGVLQREFLHALHGRAESVIHTRA